MNSELQLAVNLLKYAEVVLMCEGTNIDPISCIRFRNIRVIQIPFIEKNLIRILRESDVEFATCIYCGTPSFIPIASFKTNYIGYTLVEVMRADLINKGWLPWHASEGRPIDFKHYVSNAMVMVFYRDETEAKARVKELNWMASNVDKEIIAYRIVEE